jgi:membrane fusion protein (multidrug efflux system)
VVELARLEAQSDIAVRLAQRRLEVASKSNAKLAELELEQARHQQLIARERHEYAKVILGQHTLKSPVTGTIERVDVTIGNVVKAGQPIVRLIQSQTLWVDVAVPTAMAQALNVGHAAQVREKQDTPRQAVQGKIVFLGQTIDAATDTRLVRVEIAGPAPDNPDNSTPMLAGVYVTVTFAQPQARLPDPE